jgi:hypothetical protein
MLEWLFAGGPTMVPLALASVLALTLIFERLLALRSERVLPAALRELTPETLAGVAPETLGTSPLGRVDQVLLAIKNLSALNNLNLICLTHNSRWRTVAVDATSSDRSVQRVQNKISFVQTFQDLRSGRCSTCCTPTRPSTVRVDRSCKQQASTTKKLLTGPHTLTASSLTTHLSLSASARD